MLFSIISAKQNNHCHAILCFLTQRDVNHGHNIVSTLADDT